LSASAKFDLKKQSFKIERVTLSEPPSKDLAMLVSAGTGAFYPQFHTRPIGVIVQHGPKLPPL